MSDAPATLGIDPGLGCTGFAVLDPKGRLAHYCTYRSSTSDGTETQRGAAIAARARSLADLHGCTVAGLEWQHSVPGRGNSMLKLAGLRGAIATTLTLAGVEVHEVQPSEAKKRLTGVGNADKKQMQVAVLQRYGAEVAQDVADAVGMAEHAQRTARLRDLQPELIAEREGAE